MKQAIVQESQGKKQRIVAGPTLIHLRSSNSTSTPLPLHIHRVCFDCATLDDLHALRLVSRDMGAAVEQFAALLKTLDLVAPCRSAVWRDRVAAQCRSLRTLVAPEPLADSWPAAVLIERNQATFEGIVRCREWDEINTWRSFDNQLSVALAKCPRLSRISVGARASQLEALLSGKRLQYLEVQSADARALRLILDAAKVGTLSGLQSLFVRISPEITDAHRCGEWLGLLGDILWLLPGLARLGVSGYHGPCDTHQWQLPTLQYLYTDGCIGHLEAPRLCSASLFLSERDCRCAHDLLVEQRTLEELALHSHARHEALWQRLAPLPPSHPPAAENKASSTPKRSLKGKAPQRQQPPPRPPVPWAALLRRLSYTGALCEEGWRAVATMTRLTELELKLLAPPHPSAMAALLQHLPGLETAAVYNHFKEHQQSDHAACRAQLFNLWAKTDGAHVLPFDKRAGIELPHCRELRLDALDRRRFAGARLPRLETLQLDRDLEGLGVLVALAPRLRRLVLRVCSPRSGWADRMALRSTGGSTEGSTKGSTEGSTEGGPNTSVTSLVAERLPVDTLVELRRECLRGVTELELIALRRTENDSLEELADAFSPLGDAAASASRLERLTWDQSHLRNHRDFIENVWGPRLASLHLGDMTDMVHTCKRLVQRGVRVTSLR